LSFEGFREVEALGLLSKGTVTVGSMSGEKRRYGMPKKFTEIMMLSPDLFFSYVASIRYGYKDQQGNLHFQDEENFTVHDYSFSSSEEVVENNCAWCWEIAELTKQYCIRNSIPYHAWFMEYKSEELHQTHTQVFMLYQEKWCPTPDNSLGIKLGEHGFSDLNKSVQWFKGFFTDYLKAVLKDKYDEKKFLLKEYICEFPKGITDNEYLNRIRQ